MSKANTTSKISYLDIDCTIPRGTATLWNPVTSSEHYLWAKFRFASEYRFQDRNTGKAVSRRKFIALVKKHNPTNNGETK